VGCPRLPVELQAEKVWGLTGDLKKFKKKGGHRK